MSFDFKKKNLMKYLLAEILYSCAMYLRHKSLIIIVIDKSNCKKLEETKNYEETLNALENH